MKEKSKERRKRHDLNGQSFWADGLSVNESKVSALIIILIVGTGFAGYQCFVIGDVTAGVVELLKAVIYSIAGINIANDVSSRFGHETVSSLPISSETESQPLGSSEQDQETI